MILTLDAYSFFDPKEVSDFQYKFCGNLFKGDLKAVTPPFANTDHASSLSLLIHSLHSMIPIDPKLPNVAFTIQNIFKFTPWSASKLNHE